MAEHWAESLWRRFGSLAGVLAADVAALGHISGDLRCAEFLASVRTLLLAALRPEPLQQPVMSTSAAVLDYLRLTLGDDQREAVQALFLDARNRLIKDEQIATGTVGEAPLYPREIVRRALDVGAAGIILAHNHPSGDPYPSEADVQGTRRLVEAAHVFGIRVHDHVIIARSGWTSLRALGRM